MSWPWSELGLDGPCDSGQVKRAYALRVKAVHPEEDPEGFQQLYAAYQTARRIAQAAEQDARMLLDEMECASAERRYDYDVLFQEQTVQPVPEAGPDGGFDYDALFAEEDLEIPPPEPPPGREDAEHAEHGGGASRERLGPETGAFDYDQLLAGGEPLRPHSPNTAGPEAWDYERLFAEGDEERRQARRRKAEERLREARERRRVREQAQRDRALESEEAWSAAYAALHALEVLCSSGASVEQWSVFLHSSTFRNAQHNMDFIFGLEDFLSEHPWLPDDIKRQLYLVYQFYNGKPETMYLGLYRLLKDSGERKADGSREKIPWRKRVFRQERAPLFLLWILLSVVFIDYFFLMRPYEKAGPEPGTISVEQTADTRDAAHTAQNSNEVIPPATDSPQTDSPRVVTEDQLPEQDRQGIEAVRDLAVSLAGEDYPGPYAISSTGISSNEDGSETYYWAQCTGQDAGGETLVMNYYLTTDGAQVCCVSDEDNRGTIDLELAGTAAAGGKTVKVYRVPEIK